MSPNRIIWVRLFSERRFRCVPAPDGAMTAYELKTWLSQRLNVPLGEWRLRFRTGGDDLANNDVVSSNESVEAKRTPLVSFKPLVPTPYVRQRSGHSWTPVQGVAADDFFEFHKWSKK